MGWGGGGGGAGQWTKGLGSRIDIFLHRGILRAPTSLITVEVLGSFEKSLSTHPGIEAGLLVHL